MDDSEQNAFTAEELSPIEQDVLDEYERLAENMKKVFLGPSDGREDGSAEGAGLDRERRLMM